jgi:ABC-type nickel/cobalt efflux system permease component RcnA
VVDEVLVGLAAALLEAVVVLVVVLVVVDSRAVVRAETGKIYSKKRALIAQDSFSLKN